MGRDHVTHGKELFSGNLRIPLLDWTIVYIDLQNEVTILSLKRKVWVEPLDSTIFDYLGGVYFVYYYVSLFLRDLTKVVKNVYYLCVWTDGTKTMKTTVSE